MLITFVKETAQTAQTEPSLWSTLLLEYRRLLYNVYVYVRFQLCTGILPYRLCLKLRPQLSSPWVMLKW